MTPAKVDEHPPKIDEPEPVAPLENPASEAPEAAVPAVVDTSAIPVAAEEPKPVETPVAAPVVAAAA